MLLLAQETLTQDPPAGVQAIFWVVYAAFIVFFIVSGWKIFTKAGQPGWAILVPFYNTYVLLKIVGRPGWWLVLYLIPCVGIVVAIITNLDLARSFGKGTGFGIGLTFLAPIFYPILAFGSAQYVGPAAAQAQPAV